MIMLSAAMVVAAAQSNLGSEYRAYSECVERHFIVLNRTSQIASMALLTEKALTYCKNERASLLDRVASAQPDGDSGQRRRAAELSVMTLERYMPGKFEPAPRIVARDKCAAGLKVENHCLK